MIISALSCFALTQEYSRIHTWRIVAMIILSYIKLGIIKVIVFPGTFFFFVLVFEVINDSQ